ncbi:hypothetical protein QZH41_019397 [Actinostola sp. cb2023]|nr:hypothetical protein QZH41_019397 [Actinostola sp. cb2023]
MSSLPKLKPSHLYLYDRFNDMSDQTTIQENCFTATQELNIQLKDDGLGMYKIENNNSFDDILLCFQSEVEETLKRIQSHKGVIGVIIINLEGIPIRSTLDNSTSVQYAGLFHQLTHKARSTVRDIDPQNDLTFLRIRSKKHEIMVAPGKDEHGTPIFGTVLIRADFV